VGVVIDITDRKKAEDEIRFKNRELERFTYTVSHDLRSPLVTIRTFLPHLVDDLAQNNSENAAQDMELINTAAEKMHGLLEELLLLSRAGRSVQVAEEIPVQDIINDALALVAGRIAQRNVQVVFAGTEMTVSGERSRLLQVFQNLVDNAVKFMGDQPQPMIEIEVRHCGAEVHISVRDNGMGIDPKDADRLFDVFEKIDKHTEGAGMGLALVKRIVEAHGGWVWVESEGHGKGACFYFTVPVKNSSESGVGSSE
jgi:signal transduction histidine kinase